MIVTFCGHAKFIRTKEYENKILSLLNELIGTNKASIYLGGYGEFDAFAYDCCKKYQKSHDNVKLVFVTPYLTAEYQQNHLNYLKDLYDAITYPEIEDKPPRFAITYRNRWMIDQADYVISGVSHTWGGAYKTYQYARRRNKTIYSITDECLR